MSADDKDSEPGFHNAVRKDELYGSKGRSAWIIVLRDGRCYWGLARERSSIVVLRWHGPFAEYLQARRDLDEARQMKGWPLKFT